MHHWLPHELLLPYSFLCIPIYAFTIKGVDHNRSSTVLLPCGLLALKPSTWASSNTSFYQISNSSSNTYWAPTYMPGRHSTVVATQEHPINICGKFVKFSYLFRFSEYSSNNLTLLILTRVGLSEMIDQYLPKYILGSLPRLMDPSEGDPDRKCYWNRDF